MIPQSLSLNLRPWKKLIVKLVHIHDALIPETKSMHSKELENVFDQLKYLTLKGQTIEVHDYYVAFGKCDSCTAAYAEYSPVALAMRLKCM